MTSTLFAACAASAILTTAILIAIRPALRNRMLDVPNARSSHQHPVPRGGGVAIVGSVAATTLWLAPMSSVEGVVIAACFGMGVTGMLDDLYSLAIRPRLVAQIGIAAGTCLVVSLSAEGSGAVVATWLVGTAFVVGFTNAFNFMDGVNGISALVSSAIFGWLAYLGYRVDDDFLVLLALSVLVASLMFLPWNAPRARLFLGDVGSYFLGSTAAFMAVRLWVHGTEGALILAPFVVYIADTMFTILRRSAQGHPVGTPHRDHVYQRLTAEGLHHIAVALMVAVCTSAACVVALISPSTLLQCTVTAVLVAGYVAMPNVVRRMRQTARSTW